MKSKFVKLNGRNTDHHFVNLFYVQTVEFNYDQANNCNIMFADGRTMLVTDEDEINYLADVMDGIA